MIDWHAIAPELVLTATIMVVLLVDLILPNRAKWSLPAIASIGLLASVIPLLTLAVSGANRLVFGGTYQIDSFALVMKGLFVFAAYITLFLAMNTIEEGSYYRGEFYFLLLCAVLGMFMVASARELIVLFVAFELFSAPGYLMAAWRKYDLRSNEAGMKYFVLGVLSTAIMLMGMLMVFATTGSTKFSEIAIPLSRALDGRFGSMAALGIVLVLVGFAFKVSAVPFHFWAPDTYEGAPTPVTAFFSVAVKAAGFVGMIVLLYGAFIASGDVWRPMIWGLAFLTMTVGNVIALRQTNIVRLLAYSSIAQSGYILAPFAVVGISQRTNQLALQSAVTYLIAYAVMNLGAFGIVISVSRRTKSGDLDSINGLATKMPVHAGVMTLFLASLTGIPPLVGFFGKLQVFTALASANTGWGWTLAIAVVLNTVIAAAYYMTVVRRIYFEDPSPAIASIDGPEAPPAPIAVALAGLTVLVVLGMVTGGLNWFGDVARFI